MIIPPAGYLKRARELCTQHNVVLICDEVLEEARAGRPYAEVLDVGGRVLGRAEVIQQRIGERSRLLSQLEQAKMQETVAKSLESMSSLAAPGNTPSLDEVRDKIEQRYANAMGRAELASNSVEGRMLEVQKSSLDMAGSSRLEQIRASMAGEQLGSGQAAQPAVEQGAQTPATDPASVARLDEIRASMNQKRGDTTAAG